MKKRFVPVLLSLALLTGCASMLNRDYSSVEPHDQFSDAGAESSALRAESYQGLVNAIVYLVSRGSEQGVIRLYNYTRDVEADLSSACLEVAKQDPLGAYAVDYIKYDFARIVSYYEADVRITYRRTAEQIRNVISVTGSSAIKGELREALTRFSPEIVLRVSYFAEDEAYIGRLVTEAYYDTPEAAFGMPETSVTLYPDSGNQRVVELTLIYPDTLEKLQHMHTTLQAAAQQLISGLQGESAQLPGAVCTLLRDSVRYQGAVSAGWNTAYSALTSNRADSEGLALACHLLCRAAGLKSMVVRGTFNGEPFFWNMVGTDGGWRHICATWKTSTPLTDGSMRSAGYAWDTSSYPVCSETGSGQPKNSP